MPIAQADRDLASLGEFYLPQPGTIVALSPAFNPPILKGLKVHPENPFRFDFILDQGDSPSFFKEGVRGSSLKQESIRLIKYFLASLTIPEQDLWVNLSPYEKDRIIPQAFGKTEMGGDLLAEDYMLKQITASLMYPEGGMGKKFWKRIYVEAAKRFGTTNIPVNTFNKVWIVPEKAVVYENAKAGTAYVVESKLKVMLEQDYLSMIKNNGGQPLKSAFGNTDVNQLGSKIIREIIIPELTKEINQGANFAKLRQVYNSLILATWYKKKIKDSILAAVYENQNKVSGILNSAKSTVGDPQTIYQQYIKAFKKGAYNYIKEEFDPATEQSVSRKYFSGGFGATHLYGDEEIVYQINPAQLPSSHQYRVTSDLAQATGPANKIPKVHDKAMRIRSLVSSLNGLIRGTVAKSRLSLTPQEQADKFFDRMYAKYKKSSPDVFWIYLLSMTPQERSLIMINEGEFVLNPHWQEDVKAFAQRLNERWNDSKELKEKFGSIFPILVLSMGSSPMTDIQILRFRAQWIFNFISESSLEEQAISLWLMIVGNVFHIRIFGMHPEDNPDSNEIILNDAQALYGSEAYQGILRRYVQVMKLLKALNRLDEPVSIGNIPTQVPLKYILFWGLETARDASIFNPKHVMARFEEKARQLVGGLSDDEFMVNTLRASLGYLNMSDEETEDLMIEAASITDEQWKVAGLIPPFEMGYSIRSLGGHYARYDFKGMSFSRRIFSFLLLNKERAKLSSEAFTSVSMQDRKRMTRFAWSKMIDFYPRLAKMSSSNSAMSAQALIFLRQFIEAVHQLSVKEKSKIVGGFYDAIVEDQSASYLGQKIREYAPEVLGPEVAIPDHIGPIAFNNLVKDGNFWKVAGEVPDVIVPASPPNVPKPEPLPDPAPSLKELIGISKIDWEKIRQEEPNGQKTIALLPDGYISNGALSADFILPNGKKLGERKFMRLGFNIKELEMTVTIVDGVIKGPLRFTATIVEKIDNKLMDVKRVSQLNWENDLMSNRNFEAVNEAMSAEILHKGGIDLRSQKAFFVQDGGQSIKFQIDPAMIQQLENASGFVPVIIRIEPLQNIQEFLRSPLSKS